MQHLSILEAMRRNFDSGATRPVSFRKKQLTLLRNAVKQKEAELLSALRKDLHKAPEEAYICEIGQVLNELSHALKHLDRWAAPKNKWTPLAFFPSKSYVLPEPLGVVLIIAPWNYPVLLLLQPLIGAIAAGNCAICKPSEYAPATSAALTALLHDIFPENYVRVVEGDGAAVIPPILEGGRPDHIFFTGSIPVGREILRMAAQRLIPVTLELGGKSPAIVDESADLAIAAKRLTLGKFVNAGQTCVAPDYILVHESRKEALLTSIAESIRTFFGDDPQKSPDLGRIVHPGRFRKLVSYLQQGNIRAGGQTDEPDLYIAPTILDEVSLESPVMNEEIFGPILPVLSYKTPEEALAIIRRNPWPLALYLFSKDNNAKNVFVRSIPFGGGCINNTLVHFGNAELPIGGIGFSGMGRYHGEDSFRTFSHMKSITQSGTWLDPAIKYPPYKGKMNLFRRFFG